VNEYIKPTFLLLIILFVGGRMISSLPDAAQTVKVAANIVSWLASIVFAVGLLWYLCWRKQHKA
jgi:lipopolysaccharide export LptBFGC system permease protein LptF